MCFRQLTSLNLKDDELSKYLDSVTHQKLDSPSQSQFEVLENADNLRDFVVQLADSIFRQSVVSLLSVCTKSQFKIFDIIIKQVHEIRRQGGSNLKESVLCML